MGIFLFFKLYMWCQITQSISSVKFLIQKPSQDSFQYLRWRVLQQQLIGKNTLLDFCITQKMKFSIKDFSSKCANLLKKSLVEKISFCAALVICFLQLYCVHHIYQNWHGFMSCFAEKVQKHTGQMMLVGCHTLKTILDVL